MNFRCGNNLLTFTYDVSTNSQASEEDCAFGLVALPLGDNRWEEDDGRAIEKSSSFDNRNYRRYQHAYYHQHNLDEHHVTCSLLSA